MARRPDNWCAPADLTAWVLQLYRIDQLPTFVALVTSRIFVRAQWTRALHKPISQEPSNKPKKSVAKTSPVCTRCVYFGGNDFCWIPKTTRISICIENSCSIEIARGCAERSPVCHLGCAWVKRPKEKSRKNLPVTFCALQLFYGVFKHKLVFVQFPENILGDSEKNTNGEEDVFSLSIKRDTTTYTANTWLMSI